VTFPQKFGLLGACYIGCNHGIPNVCYLYKGVMATKMRTNLKLILALIQIKVGTIIKYL